MVDSDAAKTSGPAQLDPQLESILLTNLREALAGVDRYLVIGIVAALFYLVHVIDARLGGTADQISVPYLPISTTPGIAVVLALVVYLVAGILAGVSLRQARELIRELAARPTLLRAALKAPSRAAAGDGHLFALLPPVLLFAAFLVESLPDSDPRAISGLVLWSIPYFLVAATLWDPLDPGLAAPRNRVAAWLNHRLARFAKPGHQIDVGPLLVLLLIFGTPVVVTALLKLSFDPVVTLEADVGRLTSDFRANRIAVLREYEGKRVQIAGSPTLIGGTLKAPWIRIGGVRCNLVRRDAEQVAALRPAPSAPPVVVSGVLSGREPLALDECRIEGAVAPGGDEGRSRPGDGTPS